MAWLTFLAGANAHAVTSFSQAFSPATIAVGNVTTLTYTIDNTTGVTSLQNPDFTNTLPANMVVANPANIRWNGFSNDGSGVPDPNGRNGSINVTAASGAGSIALATNGISIPVGATSTLSVDVTVLAGAPAVLNNTLTLSDDNGVIDTSAGTLNVVQIVTTFSKAFSPLTVDPEEISTLTYTIDNTSNGSNIGVLSFTDTLPPEVTIANPSNLTHSGFKEAAPGYIEQISAIAGNAGENSVRLSSSQFITIEAGATATINVDVVASAAGSYSSTTGLLTSNLGTIGSASAALTVRMPDTLSLTKSFLVNPAVPGKTSQIKYTIKNLHREHTITDIVFSDDLNGALPGLAATGLPKNDICGTGSTLTGTGIVNLGGGSLAPGESCEITVDVSVPIADGSFTSTTSTITGTMNGGLTTGKVASDILTVKSLPEISLRFTNTPIAQGDIANLEFTVVNTSTAHNVSDIAFSIPIEAFFDGASISALPTPNPGFLGAGSLATYEDGQVNISGGSLVATGSNGRAANGTFVLAIQMPESGPTGNFVNSVNDLTATINGESLTAASASATLTVLPVVRMSKFFEAAVTENTTVELTYNLSLDVAADTDATDITFTDDLSNVIAGSVLNPTVQSQTDICGNGSTLIFDPATSKLTLSSGILTPGQELEFTVTLQIPAGAAIGEYSTSSSTVASTINGISMTGPAASATLKVIPDFDFTVSYIGGPFLPGETAVLRYSLTNNTGEDATGIAFTHNLTDVLFSAALNETFPIASWSGTGSDLVRAGSLLIFSAGTLRAGSTTSIDLSHDIPNTGVASAGQYPTSTTSSPTLSLATTGATTISPASAILNITSPTPPSVTINQASSQDDPASGNTTLFTVVFSEAVSGFEDVSDVTVAGSAGEVATSMVISEVTPNDGTTYTVSLGGFPSGTSGSVSVSIPSGAAISNSNALGNAASSSTDNTVILEGDREIPTLSLAITESSISENGGTSLVTVSRNTSTVAPLTVDLASIDTGEATVPANVIIPAGQTSTTFTVTGVDEMLVDLTQNVQITASATGFRSGKDTLDISNDDSATLSINDLTSNEGNAGTTTFTLVVTLDNAVDAPLTLDYTTVDGTGTTADNDYSSSTGTLNFTGAAGETQTFNVSVNGDAKVELDETFLVNLSNLNASGRAVTIPDSQGVGTITNDDAATLSVNDVVVAEGDSGTSTLTFTVSLDTQVDTPLAVDFATADGSGTTADNDYSSSTGTLNFTGTAGETQTFNVSANGDAKVELDETFLVNLSNLGAAGRVVTILDSQGVGSITNDDAAMFSIDDVTHEEGNTGNKIYNFTVTLNNEVDVSLSVDIATDDYTATIADNDYIKAKSTLNFDGNLGESREMTVLVRGDTKVELDETFVMNLSNVQAAGRAVTISDSQGLGELINDDAATLAINDVTHKEGDADTTTYTFTVTLNNEVDTTLSVDVATADGAGTTADSDYLSTEGTLSFVGKSGESKTIVVSVIGDKNVELDESFSVNLSNMNATGRAVTISDAQGLGTVINDDAAGLSINDLAINEGAEGITSLTLTVSLNAQVDAALTVDFATTDGTATVADGDYTAEADTLTFAGTLDETQSIMISVNGDPRIEGDENFEVNLVNIQSSGRTVDFVKSSATATILNDDQADLVIEPALDLITNEEGKLAFFHLSLQSQPTHDVTVSMESSDTSEGMIESSAVLDFTPDNWDSPQQVTVKGIDDLQADGDISYMIVLNRLISDDSLFDGVDPQDVSLTNLDDLNEAPLSAAQFLTTEEDTHLPIILAGSDVDGDPLQANIKILPLNGLLYQTSDGTSLGDLITEISTTITHPENRVIYVPSANQHGANLGDFSFTVFDGLTTSVSAVVSIDVIPVNDPPTHKIPEPLSLPEDTPLEFGLKHDLEIRVTDVDAHYGEVETTLQSDFGKITLINTDGLNFSHGDGVANAIMTFRGRVSDINAALEDILFTPTLDLTGPISIEITTNDLGNTGDQGAKETSDQLLIDYTPVNDPPYIATIAPIKTQKNEAVVVVFAVLDSDNESLSVQVAASVGPEVLFDPVQGITLEPLAESLLYHVLTLTPRFDATGFGTVTLQLTDGTSNTTQQIDVTVGSDIETSLIDFSDSLQGLEDEILKATLGIQDGAFEEESLQVSAQFSNPDVISPEGIQLVAVDGGYELQLTPVANAHGNGILSLTVSDVSKTLMRELPVSILSVPDAPQIETVLDFSSFSNELITIELSVSDVDTPVSEVELTLTSNFEKLFPTDGIKLEGQSDLRVATISPALDQVGIAEVVALAVDNEGMQHSERFQIQVIAEDKPAPKPTSIRFVPQESTSQREKPALIISWMGDLNLFGAQSVTGPYIFIESVSSPYEIPTSSEFKFFKFFAP